MSEQSSPASRIASVLAATLVVTAAFAGLLPAGLSVSQPAAAETQDTTLDTFEDNDITVEAANWNGWTGDTANFSTTSNSIAGSYSGKLLVEGKTKNTVKMTRSSNVTNVSRVSFDMRMNKTTGSASDGFRIRIENTAGTDLTTFSFVHNGSVVTPSGKIGTWKAGEGYTIEVQDINYTADTYDIVYRGERHDDLAMANNVKFGQIKVLNELSNNGGGPVSTYVDSFQLNGGTDVSGQVVSCPATNRDCQGTSLGNATVEVVAVDNSSINPKPGQSALERGNELLYQARNYSVPGWNPNYDLVGTGSLASDADQPFVLAHTADDWQRKNLYKAKFYSDYRELYDGDNDTSLEGSGNLAADPELGNPKVNPSGDQLVILSVWRPEKNLLENPVDSDIEGAVIDEGEIVIEQLGPRGGIVNTNTTETHVQFNSFGKPIETASVRLDDGFYRVYPKNNSATSYVIAVGDPKRLINLYRKDLRSEGNQLVKHAKNLRDRFQNDTFRRRVVETNKTGHFSANMPAQFQVVAVSAYRMDGKILPAKSNPSPDEMVEYLKKNEYNGSVYIGPPENHELPARNLTIKAIEATRPTYQNISNLNQFWSELFGRLENISHTELATLLQNPGKLTDKARNETEQGINSSRNTGKQASDQAVEDAQNIADRQDIDVDVTVNPDKLSDKELKKLAEVWGQYLQQQASSDVADGSTSVGTNTTSATFSFSEDIPNPSAVTVYAHYSNGTSEVVDKQFWSLNKRAGRGDQVVISDYPLGANEPSAVSFEVVTATDDNGIARGRARAVNPTVSGSLPKLTSVSFNTLRPGPSDKVELTPHGVAQVNNATVWGPSGSKLAVSGVNTSEPISFETAGQGTHVIRLKMQSAQGVPATEVIRLQAGKSDLPMPAGVRAVEGPTGTYALVGDGFTGGNVKTDSGGQQVFIEAQIASDADVPSTAHIYTTDLTLSPETDATIQLTRGEQSQTIRKRVGLSYHGAQLPDGAHVWRTCQDNPEPIPKSGSSQGDRTTTNTATVVDTYTCSDGGVALQNNPNPGLLDQAQWTFETTVPDVEVPGLSG